MRLGRAISEALAASGCRMILHCNTSRQGTDELANRICSSGGEAKVLRADLSKSGAGKKLARKADALFNGVDILVNNAAIFWPTSLEHLNESELDTFYAVNLRAPFSLASELGRAMKHRSEAGREGCAILNIACLSGLRAWKTHIPYSISKAGVVSLTQGLAKLLAPGVRVNAIAPGSVLPPENASLSETQALLAKIPLKKIGTPNDVVETALYALTAPFVTGQILCVDGGRCLV